MKHALAIPAIALAFSSCMHDQAGTATNDIQWADGDSGVLNGEGFQLAFVDSPEIGEAGSQDGAKCPQERAHGLVAKAFMEALTATAQLEVTERLGTDPQGRTVIRLSADGADVSATAIAAGHMAEWPFENGRPAAPKPDWCPAD